MVGSKEIIRSVILGFILILILVRCSDNIKLSRKDNDIVIKLLNNPVTYNHDILHYYIINKSDRDIRILCNPEFFKREKDTLIIDTWFNPKITIIDSENDVVPPNTYSVDYIENVQDSIKDIRNRRTDYQEIDSTNSSKFHENLFKNYFAIIKKHDSIEISTKINFEGETRFYDLYGQEGYILKKDMHYTLRICLNENINPNVKNFLKRENIYLQEICSNNVKLIFIKTNYSE